MNVDPAAIASFFTGGYGLDLAVERILPDARLVFCVEREGFAVEHLAHKMETGLVAPAPICTDIREVDGRAWHGLVDCVIAGFPCTDISTAGKREGIQGEHSGLWFELARVIGEMGPSVCFLENVSALTVRGLDEVLGSLAELGFDAEWGCLRASDVGASHERNRIFILAYARRLGADGLQSKLLGWGCREAVARAGGGELANAHGSLVRQEPPAGAVSDRRGGAELANAERSERRSREPGHGHDAGRAEEADRAGAHRGEVGHAQGIAGRSGWGREREGARSRIADPRGSGFEVADNLADPDRDGQQIKRGELPEDRDAQSRRHADGRRTADPPPGPHDAAGWAAYLKRWPGLDPSLARPLIPRPVGEFRGGPHGLAPGLVLDGLLLRLDRLRLLGNGVVPDQAEWAFRQLIARSVTK